MRISVQKQTDFLYILTSSMLHSVVRACFIPEDTAAEWAHNTIPNKACHYTRTLVVWYGILEFNVPLDTV